MIDRLDHLVLTVASIPAAVAFYEGVLGFRAETRDGRTALHVGDQKINLHEVGHEFSPRARAALPGTADLCFTTGTPIGAVMARLAAAGIAVEEGPVARTGARAPLTSVYCRDPDGNLVEIANETG